MNIITSVTLYFIIIGIVIIGLALFYFNFSSILNFKWYIDYFHLTDKTCNTGNLSKLEIDRLRYNLYSFLNDLTENEIHFSTIEKNFKLSFYLFIVYYLIFVCAPSLYFGYLTYYQKIKTLNPLIYSSIPLTYVIIGYVWIVYFIYIGVNASVVSIFDNIRQQSISENNAITRYKRVYKILNALILINNMHDKEMEYVNEKLNGELLTFDQIIEANIASRENISNTSKIKQIKLRAFDKLDFCKYLVLDSLSNHYLKFFKNIYVKIPNTFSDLYDVSENIYLSELYKKNDRTTYKFEKINGIYNEIVLELNKNGKENNTYNAILEKINTKSLSSDNDKALDVMIQQELEFKQELLDVMDKDKGLEAYNKILYDTIIDLINKVAPKLKDPVLNQTYDEVNAAIEMKIKMDKDTAFEVEKQDYIKYLVENMDIILNADDANNTDFIDIINKTNELGSYIYAYIVFWFGILMFFAHILFVKTNSIIHSVIMTLLVCVYIAFFYYSTVIKNAK